MPPYGAPPSQKRNHRHHPPQLAKRPPDGNPAAPAELSFFRCHSWRLLLPTAPLPHPAAVMTAPSPPPSTTVMPVVTVVVGLNSVRRVSRCDIRKSGYRSGLRGASDREAGQSPEGCRYHEMFHCCSFHHQTPAARTSCQPQGSSPNLNLP
jgi:hypothetical protein